MFLWHCDDACLIIGRWSSDDFLWFAESGRLSLTTDDVIWRFLDECGLRFLGCLVVSLIVLTIVFRLSRLPRNVLIIFSDSINISCELLQSSWLTDYCLINSLLWKEYRNHFVKNSHYLFVDNYYDNYYKVEEDERVDLIWWKLKKWAVHTLTRLFERWHHYFSENLPGFALFCRVVDPDWIRVQWGPWIRIRTRIANPDPDPGGQKWPTKIEKSY